MIDRFINLAGEWIIGMVIALVCGLLAIGGVLVAVLMFLVPIAWALLPVGVLLMIARYLGWL